MTQSGAVAIGYDARGNLTSSGGDTFGYSAENLLTSKNAHTLSYDPLMRLYQIDGAVRFGYDGMDLIGEWTPGGSMQRRYVHAPGTDQPIVWYEGSGTSDRRYLHTDERGSVVAVSDDTGAGIGIDTYDEYGIPGSGNIGRFQYTGQAYLGEVGLHYYKARMYSPTLGRFLQTDPIGYGDGMNWYGYVSGDPMNHGDVTGTTATYCTGSIIPSVSGDCSHVSFLSINGVNTQSAAMARQAEQISYLTGLGFSDQVARTAVRLLPNYGYAQALEIAYHEYGFGTVICNISQYGCTLERAFDGLRLNAAPGQVGAAITGNIVHVPGIGDVRQVVNYSNLSVTNITLMGHRFYLGTVTRTVTTWGNNIQVMTNGSGTGSWRWLNMASAQPAFTALDLRIRLYTTGSLWVN